MLETIREYAGEQLEQRGETELLGERHAQYFLALAEETAPRRAGPGRGRGRTSGTTSTTSEARSSGLSVRATRKASFASQPLHSGIYGRSPACASSGCGSSPHSSEQVASIPD